MKSVLLIAFALAANGFSQPSEFPVIVNLYGGMSKALGEGSGDVNMGFNLGGALLKQVNPNFAMGANVTYNRWTADVPPGLDLEASTNITEVLAVVRAITPANNGISAFGQIGGGIHFASASISGNVFGEPIDESNSEQDLGLSFGMGVNINRIFIMPSYKIMFGEDDTVKWFALSAGLNL